MNRPSGSDKTGNWDARQAETFGILDALCKSLPSLDISETVGQDGATMRDVKTIIEDAGGPRKIAEATKDTRWRIVPKSVYDWLRIGIPEKHWPVISKLTKTNPVELHEANKEVRARPTESVAA